MPDHLQGFIGSIIHGLLETFLPVRSPRTRLLNGERTGLKDFVRGQDRELVVKGQRECHPCASRDPREHETESSTFEPDGVFIGMFVIHILDPASFRRK